MERNHFSVAKQIPKHQYTGLKTVLFARQFCLSQPKMSWIFKSFSCVHIRMCKQNRFNWTIHMDNWHVNVITMPSQLGFLLCVTNQHYSLNITDRSNCTMQRYGLKLLLLLLLSSSSSSSSNFSLLTFGWEIFTYPGMQQSTGLCSVVLFVV